MSEFGWVEMKMLGERIGGIAPEAFQFVREGLGHTVKMVHGEHQEVASRTGASPVSSDSPGPDARHISGRQLCMGRLTWRSGNGLARLPGQPWSKRWRLRLSVLVLCYCVSRGCCCWITQSAWPLMPFTVRFTLWKRCLSIPMTFRTVLWLPLRVGGLPRNFWRFCMSSW